MCQACNNGPSFRSAKALCLDWEGARPSWQSRKVSNRITPFIGKRTSTKRDTKAARAAPPAAFWAVARRGLSFVECAFTAASRLCRAFHSRLRLHSRQSPGGKLPSFSILDKGCGVFWPATSPHEPLCMTAPSQHTPTRALPGAEDDRRVTGTTAPYRHTLLVRGLAWPR